MATKTLRPPPSNIVKPSDVLFAKVLIFGDAGIGKTHLLGSAQDDPRTNPMLILDFEGGTSTLAGLDIDVWPVRGRGEFEKAHRYLASGDHPYKSVALDSLSEVHRATLLELSEDHGKGNNKIEDVNDPQEYGQALTYARRLIRLFRDLDLHVFYTAHAKDARDPRAGTIRKVSLDGKAADEVPGMVDVCAYMTWMDIDQEGGKEPHRVLVLKNDPKIRAKIRTGWQADVEDGLLDPTITKLLDTLNVPHRG